MNAGITTRSAGLSPSALRARDVADLTVASGYPCISVLLPTEPAPRMRPEDLHRLRGLVSEVDLQLREHGVTSRGRLLRELADQVHRWAAQPTDRAVAIYVSLAVVRSFRLPQAVQARAVVEPTFATRALVSALHRMPPHAVLVLHPTCAHLYAAADGELRPVGRLDPFRATGSIGLPRAGEPGVDDTRQEVVESYLLAVDRMLADYRAQHPSPLVLAGSPHLLDRFSALSRNLGRLAGRVATHEHESALDLVRAGGQVIEDYLRTRRQDALQQLDRTLRDRPDDVVSGIADCERGVRTRAPGMLLVEEGYICPGIPVRRPGRAGPGASGTQPTPADEVHDLVDDLMEQVIVRGGQLALVRDGELTAHQRIALVLQGGTGRHP